MLSDEICETAPDGSVSVVSTSTTLMPAAMAWAIGGRLADTSLGAIRIASGCAAVTDSMIGFCSVASNCEGPWMLTVMLPIFLASAWMPQPIVT